jgi:hypothetical protein
MCSENDADVSDGFGVWTGAREPDQSARAWLADAAATRARDASRDKFVIT